MYSWLLLTCIQIFWNSILVLMQISVHGCSWLLLITVHVFSNSVTCSCWHEFMSFSYSIPGCHRCQLTAFQIQLLISTNVNSRLFKSYFWLMLIGLKSFQIFFFFSYTLLVHSFFFKHHFWLLLMRIPFFTKSTPGFPHMNAHLFKFYSRLPLVSIPKFLNSVPSFIAVVNSWLFKLYFWMLLTGIHFFSNSIPGCYWWELTYFKFLFLIAPYVNSGLFKFYYWLLLTRIKSNDKFWIILTIQKFLDCVFITEKVHTL